MLHEFRVRRLSQQGREGVLGGLVGRVQDKQRHQQAHPAVDHQPRKLPHQGCHQHGGGRDGVRKAVHCGGAHSRGVDLLPHRPVIIEHIQLHTDGYGQDGQHRHRGGHLLRMQDLLQGRFPQLHAHKQDQPRHHQTGYVLHAPVSEGMLRVRLASRQAESQQRHQRGACVG